MGNLITGVKDGTHFKLSFVTTKKEDDANSQSTILNFVLFLLVFAHEEDVKFSGYAFICQFYKNFNSHTIIANKNDKSVKFRSNYDVLDNTLFNKNFRVYSDDADKVYFKSKFYGKNLKFQTL
ncbi:DUF3137 domain-containing protein [Campylobacter corcagiensis]|uniref:DUF3137 domain-containing protein n=1 Tax=Campylobacter corcagiensis TaxID=1448857 RepID=A0A7M1LGL6_9BACT|nr:DUF3137 domain-containing protein [Campylobacter corcagiensis]QOQ87483.1 DUF3137 domain-containing protein [Campylobacter corcagiensis]